ncbi:hypothetical protein HX870_04635 [Pseudomonas gingeri]|uniref:hypothetical protein n=1 Tax=Pseudomonas gingeri TaxID=117681 RepID=UPI0015A34624|nr:hypothetical protein [Pseudomonas gingeri]NWD66899.1 hypothetical protein [Pseudomonas gingeri]
MADPNIEQLAERVNTDVWLVHRGRYLSTRFLLTIGVDQYVIEIHKGRIETIEHGPFVMARWTFAMKGEREVWEKFSELHPVPRFHDLMALIRFKTLLLEGDQHPFIANLLYFKDVFAYLRPLEIEL